MAWPSAPAASRGVTSPLPQDPSGFWEMFSSVSSTPSSTVGITWWGWPLLSLRAVTSVGQERNGPQQGSGCHPVLLSVPGGEDTQGCSEESSRGSVHARTLRYKNVSSSSVICSAHSLFLNPEPIKTSINPNFSCFCQQKSCTSQRVMLGVKSSVPMSCSPSQVICGTARAALPVWLELPWDFHRGREKGMLCPGRAEIPGGGCGHP